MANKLRKRRELREQRELSNRLLAEEDSEALRRRIAAVKAFPMHFYEFDHVKAKLGWKRLRHCFGGGPAGNKFHYVKSPRSDTWRCLSCWKPASGKWAYSQMYSHRCLEEPWLTIEGI